MSQLAPQLFERRFQDLMELGRARLPSLSPEWTDHNAHDPGITLMELLAWVAEAQLYSLSRLRRDERTAYAALLGITAAGTRGANGLIWPKAGDASSPAATYTRSQFIPDDAAIHVVGADHPIFRPWQALLWAPGEITRLETRTYNGRVVDHTEANARGEISFTPFGASVARRAVLTMTFKCRDKAGLLGADRARSQTGLWPIGVRVALPSSEVVQETSSSRSPLVATLVSDEQSVELPIALDTTQGLLATGVILLDLRGIVGSPTEFSIELRYRGGAVRPPRVLRIEPNVIPIVQERPIFRERHESNGQPDFSFQLESRGLRFNANEEPVQIETVERSGVLSWDRTDRLLEAGPQDKVFEFDPATCTVRFGNGINGRVPDAGTQVLATYSISDGERGGVVRNRQWNIAGFRDPVGVNSDPIAGGADSADWIGERREARRRLREEHVLVTRDDIALAAKKLTLLEVARAWVLPARQHEPRTGVITLVAMRSRTSDDEEQEERESPRWLEAIRCRLVPRMLLGTRLHVVAPRYVEFSIHAVVVARPGADPASVENAIRRMLARRLNLVDSTREKSMRQPGVSLTVSDVTAWIRTVEGVASISAPTLRNAQGEIIESKTLSVPRAGLPCWNYARSSFEVRRSETRRSS